MCVKWSKIVRLSFESTFQLIHELKGHFKLHGDFMINAGIDEKNRAIRIFQEIFLVSSLTNILVPWLLFLCQSSEDFINQVNARFEGVNSRTTSDSKSESIEQTAASTLQWFNFFLFSSRAPRPSVPLETCGVIEPVSGRGALCSTFSCLLFVSVFCKVVCCECIGEENLKFVKF